jgi:iron-sulfur cluster repair protein YtfE (RIC family)
MSVKSVVNSAGNAVLKAVGAGSSDKGRDLLKTLKEEHDQLKALLEELEDATSTAQRRTLVNKIKHALVPHAKAEEKVLYTAIIGLKDKEAQIDGHEGNIEHDLAAKTLQKLAGITNAGSSEHKATSKVLHELLTHHIQEEESNVWGDAKKYFTEADRMKMNQRYLAAKQQVKVS